MNQDGRLAQATRHPRLRRPRSGYARVARAATSGRVVIVGASVGQGHDGAATELARRLATVGMDVAVHDYLDAHPAAARHALRDLYAPTVQYLPAVFDGLFRGLERPGPPRRLADWTSTLARPRMALWATGADAVVSTYPLACQALRALGREGRVSPTAIRSVSRNPRSRSPVGGDPSGGAPGDAARLLPGLQSVDPAASAAGGGDSTTRLFAR
jgi:processive 1,2-diacylglycerol beta-glucosyltransferase